MQSLTQRIQPRKVKANNKACKRFAEENTQLSSFIPVSCYTQGNGAMILSAKEAMTFYDTGELPERNKKNSGPRYMFRVVRGKRPDLDRVIVYFIPDMYSFMSCLHNYSDAGWTTVQHFCVQKWVILADDSVYEVRK